MEPKKWFLLMAEECFRFDSVVTFQKALKLLKFELDTKFIYLLFLLVILFSFWIENKYSLKIPHEIMTLVLTFKVIFKVEDRLGNSKKIRNKKFHITHF